MKEQLEGVTAKILSHKPFCGHAPFSPRPEALRRGENEPQRPWQQGSQPVGLPHLDRQIINLLWGMEAAGSGKLSSVRIVLY